MFSLLDGRLHFLSAVMADGADIVVGQLVAVVRLEVAADLAQEALLLLVDDRGNILEGVRTMFIKFSSIYGRCSKACEHHTVLTSNLFNLSAKKAQMLALRINMISKKTVRQKLQSYFEYMREKTGSDSFETEMSLSQLATYLCVDRTSLMRELRLMREEGLIENTGRKVIMLE